MLIKGVTGLAFEARPWVVSDQKIVLDRKLARSGETLERMLSAIDLGLQNRGPYEFTESGPVPWGRVCTADLLACLVRARIATDPILSINHVCAHCGEQLPLEIDLNNIEYDPISPAAISYIRSSQQGRDAAQSGISLFIDPDKPKAKLYDAATCEPKIPAEATKLIEIRLRLLFGADHKTLAKLQREDPSGMLELETALRICSVKLPDGSAIEGLDRAREWYGSQSWAVQRNIDEFVDKLEGGPDTDVEIECKNCRRMQRFRIPFGPDFFGLKTS